MCDIVKRYRKAIAGAITAGAAALVLSLDHGGITTDEWVQIAGAIAAGALGVAVAPANVPGPGRRRRHVR